MAQLSFEKVHRAAENTVLPEEAWRLVEPRLPWSGFWFAWDRCQRLRAGVIDLFVDRDLQPGTFAYLVEKFASLFAGPFPLTRTHAINNFSRFVNYWGTGVTWSTYRKAGCWAEPNSFAWTTWHWDRSTMYFPGIWDMYSEVLGAGEYHNNDFGFDDLPTWVSSAFGLTFSNAIITYNAYHFADGEGVVGLPAPLIWGHVNLGWNWHNCERWW